MVGIAKYRLRDLGARCSGPVTVYRAEVLDRPGQLVRLTCVNTTGGSTHLAAAVAAWREVRHPALLPVESMEHEGDTLLFRSPGATARPVDTLDTLSVLPTTVARIGEGIAEGLAALHLRGRTHGSVGAHTILLGTEGTAVLDGPWHAACLADGQDANDSGAPAPPGIPAPPDAPDAAAQDVRALTATLLDLLDMTGEQVGLALHGSGSRSAAAPPLLRTTGPTPAPADVDALRALLQTQERQPGTAGELRQALRAWHAQAPPASPDEGSTPPMQRRGRGTRDPSDGGSAPGPGRPRGRTLAVALGALLLLGVVVVARPAPSTIAPPTATSAPTDTAPATPGPTRSTTSTPAPVGTGPAPPAAAEAGPSDATPNSAPRRVCPGALAPPGRGRLVLADLDGRGCRAVARVDGDRLAARDLDGSVIQVEFDLEPGDQVRVADLGGTGRDEVVVYRPGTGEVFRFAGLTDPGEAVTVHGQASGRIGGTAVVRRDLSGGDRLEIRGASPA